MISKSTIYFGGLDSLRVDGEESFYTFVSEDEAIRFNSSIAYYIQYGEWPGEDIEICNVTNVRDRQFVKDFDLAKENWKGLHKVTFTQTFIVCVCVCALILFLLKFFVLKTP